MSHKRRICLTIILLGLWILAIPFVIAQNTVKSPKNDSADTESTSDLPKNPDLLADDIEDTKAKINKLENQISSWKSATEQIREYKQDFEELDSKKIDDDVKELETSFKSPDKKKTTSSLRKLITDFFTSPTNYLTYSLASDAELASLFRNYSKQMEKVTSSYKSKIDSRYIELDSVFTETDTNIDFNQDDFNNISQILNSTSFNNLKKEMAEIISQLETTLNEKIQEKEEELRNLRKRRTEAQNALDKSKADINLTAIWLGLPLFCLTVILLYVIPFWGRWVLKDSSSNAEQMIFNSGLLTEIITILLLTMTILILGLAGKMPGEVLGTLIGGISGYVLNRIREKKNDTEVGVKENQTSTGEKNKKKEENQNSAEEAEEKEKIGADKTEEP